MKKRVPLILLTLQRQSDQYSRYRPPQRDADGANALYLQLAAREPNTVLAVELEARETQAALQRGIT
jgi:hypothetical protein